MISDERKQAVESALKNKGVDITILWETSFKNKSGNDYKVYVKCNKDEHVQIRDVSSLRKGSFTCQTCLNRKYTERLNQFDFNFVELVLKPSTNFVKFSCKRCGEERQLSVGNLMNVKKLICYKCRQNLVESNLKLKGCCFIDRVYDRSYTNEGSQCRIIYTDTDGVERSASEQNVLRYNFTPSSSHWEQRHFLYIFKSKDINYPYIKIGTANAPDRRLKDLKLTFDCEVISFEYDSRHSANKIEGNCHRKFKENRLNKDLTETFTLGLSRPRKDGSRIKMGCTEWFEDSIFEQAVEYIKSLRE